MYLCCGQVSQDGKSLLDKLQRPLTPGSSDSLTASANYSKAVHHVLDVIHEVLHHQRQLENIWQHRKVRLHQRLQLCVFQQDVQQVGVLSCSSWGVAPTELSVGILWAVE
jgi:triple functional domain protein